MFLLTNLLNCALLNQTSLKWGGVTVKKEMVFKAFVYFLSISFLLLTNGFPRIAAAAAEKGFPFGEMVSKGDVKFEARDKVWKSVDPSHFPIFQGLKIKTEKGTSILALADNCQIEVGQNSLLTFDQSDRLRLVQGSIDFRIPAATAMEFKIGSIFVLPSRSLQASKSPSVPLPKIEEAIGSITIHSNGAVTVKSIKGSLSILSEDRVVLASLSPKDTVTLPSVIVKTPSRIMVAQAGETAREVESREKRRQEEGYWILGGFAAAIVAAGIGIYYWDRHEERKERKPICP